MSIEELKEAHEKGRTIQFRLDGRTWVDWLRAGYWCGKYIEKEDIDGENDRGPEDVQVRP